MAILVIYDRDNTHIDPIKDRAGCYKRGMIVEVLDDSKHDGNLVRNPISPPWIILRVIGMTRNHLLKYQQPQQESAVLENKQIVRKRQYTMLLDDLPSEIKEKIGRDRYAEINHTDFMKYVKDLKTGVMG